MEVREFQFKVQLLREVFRGRYTQEEVTRVLEEFGEDELQALDFLLCEDPAEVSRFLHRTTNYIETLQSDSRHLQEFLDNSEIVVKPSERMFACQPCNRSWWKKVPFRKEVSRCKSCLVRYEAIPKDKEWGIGVFPCQNCSKEFRGWAIMGMTISTCYQCHMQVAVTHILSPKKSERVFNSRDSHQCNGINCYNRNQFTSRVSHTINPTDQVPICAHPKSRHLIPPGATFLVWSLRHASSGSTVSTFMDQGSLSSRSGVVAATPVVANAVATATRPWTPGGAAPPPVFQGRQYSGVVAEYRPPVQQHSYPGWRT